MTEVKLIRIQTIQIPDWLRLYELLNLVFPQGGAGLGPDTASCSQSGFCFNFQINYQGDQPAQCNALLYWTELAMEIRKWRICINMCSALRDGRSGAIFFINN